MVKRPTIRDVAKSAGVSIATVSFVLNNRPGQAISERVRKRVVRAAETLHYHPTAAAAGLARKRTHNIAVVFYGEDELISNQFYSFVVQGAIKEVVQHPYNLLFSFIESYGGIADLPKAIREHNAEGALLIQHVHLGLVEDLRARGVPIVAVDPYPATRGVDLLEIDNHQGGALVAEHLLSLGHRHVGVIGAGTNRPSIRERVRGLESALRAGGVRLRREDVHQGRQLSFVGGYEGALQVLEKKKRPTAIFCVNDEVAAGSLRAAREIGLELPRDLSVVGFDDITLANYTDPPLTTVGVNKEDLGARAVRRLIALVDSRDRKARPRRDVVPVELVRRESTSGPPKAGAANVKSRPRGASGR